MDCVSALGNSPLLLNSIIDPISTILCMYKLPNELLYFLGTLTHFFSFCSFQFVGPFPKKTGP